MLGQNAPFGFAPDRNGPGGGTTRLNQYYIAGALAANIYRGSVVKSTGTTKQITAAAAGNEYVGVFNGCNYVDAGGNTQFRPYWGSGQTILTGTLVEAQIYDDPFTMFRVQVSGSGLLASNLGNIGDLVIGTGSQVTGQSGDQLDQTTFATPGTQFEVDDVFNGSGPPLSGFGQYAIAIVRQAKNYYGPTIGAL